MGPRGASSSRVLGATLAAVVFAATAAAWVAHTWTPPPSAELARGTEEAFAIGLYPRELRPRQPPLRWTGERAVFRFRHLPEGARQVEVSVRGHRGPVAVVARGVVLGVVAAGAAAGRFDAPGDGTRLDVEIRPQAPFEAGGRRLGVVVDRVAVLHSRPAWPGAGLVALFAAPALALALAGLVAGLRPPGAGTAALGILLVQVVSLRQGGALRSPYAAALCWTLVAGALLAGLAGAWAERRSAGAGRWAFAALGAALLVQWVAASSPVMVVSDAVFHGNKLAQVARGDLWPTSVTQHVRPFRIPYGVSFYAALTPLFKLGLDPVDLVRKGAAAAGVAASAALFLLVWRHRPAREAALATVALQMLPGVFDVHSYGNLSNVFGQAATAVYFAWWAGRAPGGFAVGGGLLATAALAHLSSLVVLVPLGLALGGVRWREDRAGSRSRLLALAVGLGLAVLYHAPFWGLVTEQLPRLLEGGGQGRGASQGAAGALRMQLLGALGQWGWPAVVLAVVGRPRPRRSLFDRELTVFWLAGAVLLIPAALSPLDVRYLYALTIPLAAAAGSGLEALWQGGGIGRLAGGALLAVQALLAWRNIAEAVLTRYR